MKKEKSKSRIRVLSLGMGLTLVAGASVLCSELRADEALRYRPSTSTLPEKSRPDQSSQLNRLLENRDRIAERLESVRENSEGMMFRNEVIKSLETALDRLDTEIRNLSSAGIQCR